MYLEQSRKWLKNFNQKSSKGSEQSVAPLYCLLSRCGRATSFAADTNRRMKENQFSSSGKEKPLGSLGQYIPLSNLKKVYPFNSYQLA